MSIWCCIYCGHEEETPIRFPEGEKDRDWKAFWGPLRRRCPKCGRFLLPQEIWERSIGTNNGQWIYETFSQCPNAWECNLFELYSGACETRQLRVDCLRVLHKKIDLALLKVEELEERMPKRRGARTRQQPQIGGGKVQ